MGLIHGKVKSDTLNEPVGFVSISTYVYKDEGVNLRQGLKADPAMMKEGTRLTVLM